MLSMLLLQLMSFSFVSADAATLNLFKNVQYRCNPTSALIEGVSTLELSSPLIKKNMKKYFEGVVTVGIEHLKKINQDLAEKAVYSLKSRHLTIDCAGATASNLTATIFNPSGNGDEIYLGMLLYDILLISSADVKINLIPESIEEIAAESDDQALQIAALFHEFLHFARFDNLPGEEHNRLYKHGELGSKDLVYSCMAAAFPNASKKWFRDDGLKKAIKFCSTFKAENCTYN